jgi:tetratricopeptide (TPR) repeat protein
MVIENTRLLFKLYTRPSAAMSEIIDQGNWLYGAALVTVIAALLTFTVTYQIYETYEAAPVPRQRLRLPGTQPAKYQIQTQAEAEEYYQPRRRTQPLPIVGNTGWLFISFRPMSQLVIALSLAVLYVPALILLLVMIERTSSFAVAFRRDYGSLLSCTYLAWAASHLPFALAGLAFASVGLSGELALLLWLLGNLYFGALMLLAVRTAVGASYKNTAIAVGLAWIALRFDSWVLSILTFSPFLTLIWLLPLALGALAGLRAAYRQRQGFRRHLQAAALNEHDAEAQYQLGLVYQQRRQQAEAMKYFRRAVEIDPKEPDANYQLGIAARLEGRLQEAIQHFSIVVAHDDKYRQSEIWREIGATYLAAGMHEEAKDALEKYIGRRPYDPEGLFHLAETLSKLGEQNKAQDFYHQCIEAVKTMPYYRRNEVNKWSKLAQEKL